MMLRCVKTDIEYSDRIKTREYFDNPLIFDGVVETYEPIGKLTCFDMTPTGTVYGTLVLYTRPAWLVRTTRLKIKSKRTDNKTLIGLYLVEEE